MYMYIYIYIYIYSKVLPGRFGSLGNGAGGETFFVLKPALPGLLDGSWASPGAPSCALGPLWACLACRPVLFGRLLDALGRPTWPLNCQTAVRKPWQVAPSACQALPQACRTFKKP